MSGIKILGTGSYKPPGVLTNAMLESVVETDDAWIVSRTGIRERAISDKDETSLSMSLAACRAAMEQSGARAEDIGVIVAATLTGDYLTPSLSCLLQRELGLSTHVLPLDINCACSGFVFALKTAHSLLADMPDKCALVIGCEMLTRITDYTDRSTCILFGDGAGAAVIRRTEEGIFAFDGGGRGDSELLVCKAQYIGNSPFVDQSRDRVPDGLFMNGPEVFRFALEAAPASIAASLEKAGVEMEAVQHFVLHQANGRIIEGIQRRFGIPPEKCYVNIGTTGNTSSASVAIALDELHRSGAIAAGEIMVIAAFGGGLTFASVCLAWQ